MKFGTLYFLVIAILFISCKNTQNQALFRIQEDGKYGFIDSLGKVIISPTYDYASKFEDNLALVIMDTLYGYIDKKGEEVISVDNSIIDFARTMFPNNRLFNSRDSLSQGRNSLDNLRLSLSDEYESHLENQPDTLFDYKPFDKLNYHDGLALFVNEEGLFGYRDKKFITAIECRFTSANPFSESFAVATIPKDSTEMYDLGRKTGIIDTEGNFVLQPKFDFISDFSNGYATATIKDFGKDDDGVDMFNLSAFLVDKEGKIVNDFPSDINGTGPVINGFVRGFNMFLGQHKFIDVFNKIESNVEDYWFVDARDPIFIGDFDGTLSDGSVKTSWINNYYKFPVKIGDNGKWGLLPLEGGFIETDWVERYFIYDDIYNMRDGLIAAKKGGKWGYIDVDDRIAIDFKYTKVESFKNGLAYVENKQLGSVLKSYIDKNGNVVYSYLQY